MRYGRVAQWRYVRGRKWNFGSPEACLMATHALVSLSILSRPPILSRNRPRLAPYLLRSYSALDDQSSPYDKLFAQG